ncbi:alpha-2-macroglobulin family protein [Tenacibaculum geojense]|uniref:Alpha-2-macroglobulin family protein n=1 Tax=Tenacibaculum geojense TaxID=915352 RepID=A0ABW3JS13_9FLAO
MKKLTPILLTLFLFSITLNAQENYEELWSEVHKYELDNLPKSALKVVENIYKKADLTNNSPQIIKALIFKSKFSLILEEDAQLKIVNDLKKHINNAKFPTKNVLENILANLYWQYFNQNRWRFYNRTNTNSKVNIDDFRTWDLQTLFKEIHKYYQLSINDSEKLQKIPVKTFSDIIDIDKNAEKYRPTLYDFLAHNALEFYQTNETNITQPSYQFKLKDSDLICDANHFSDMKITSKDSLSLQLNALKIYKKLIKYHLSKNNVNALADVDLLRLDFVKKHASFNNINKLYLETLQQTAQQHKNHEISGLYDHRIALLYREKANTYHAANNKNHQFKNADAVEICKKVIDKFPKTKAAKLCTNLLNDITQKSLAIKAEEHVPSQVFSKILVTYKNIDELDVTIYSISEKQDESFKAIYKQEEKINFIAKLKQVANFQEKLKNEKDYQQHSSEIVLPKLGKGKFLIVAKNNSDTNEVIIKTQTIQVTNLVLVTDKKNNENIFRVYNRLNGKPLANVKIQLSNKKHRYGNKINKKLTTNNNGFVSHTYNKDYYNVSAKLTFNDDVAYFDNIYLTRRYNNNYHDNNVITNVSIFTDRAIYRPGQTVYFKGIALEKFKNKSEVLAHDYLFVNFKDANGQLIKELELKTNDFGSFSEEYKIPEIGLTGNFNIEVIINTKRFYKSIAVEEYKRPKFQTEFKPVTKTYKVNDSVTVTGIANAYSGASISNAKVVYRVHRKVQYPRWYWWSYWRKPSFNSAPQEITYGETVTNSNGEYFIKFKALPDESVAVKNQPIFTYEITADVIDINGETRTSTTNVKVGYHTMIPNIEFDTRINKKSNSTPIHISINNLNGEKVKASGTIKIFKLKAPENIYRKRPWQNPDYQIIAKDQFTKKFPYESYTNEDDFHNWGKEKLVFEEQFSSIAEKKIVLSKIKKWKSGKYIITLDVKDSLNQSVSDILYFDVYADTDKLPADNQIFNISTNKKEFKPGDEVELTVSSNATNLHLTLFVEKNNKIFSKHYFNLDKSYKKIKIPVTKNDLGGFGITYHYIYRNSFYASSYKIEVPYPSKEIEITTNTFRDKISPNSLEKWSFNIKGPKKDVVLAEILASMYDASLDQFATNNWTFNPFNLKNYYVTNYASANASIGIINFNTITNPQKKSIYIPNQKRNTFNWFGFSLNNNKWVYKNYLRKLTMQRTKFDGTLSGVVEDETGPLPGVSVLIKGTNYGTETDFDGNFEIKVNKGDIVQFNYVGFETIELTVEDFNKAYILMEGSNTLDEVVVVGYGTQKRKKMSKVLEGKAAGVTVSENLETVNSEADSEIDEVTENKQSLSQIKARKNLQETAFFYPHLTTDKEGNVSFSFTTPEALTTWKLQLLSHTKNLEYATKTLEAVSQKELMVTPNAPRFLREGDTITLSSKISNLTKSKLSGNAQLFLTDAITGKNIDVALKNTDKQQSFSVDSKGNTQVSWQLIIPPTVSSVKYKIVAQAGNFSDGEQNILPVLPNRMLVTETLPMWIGSNQTKNFNLDKLKNYTSTTLSHHKLTLEVSSNPVWYAVQALPYLMEYPFECAEQTFSRYYANSLASHIINKNPKIKTVFESWKNSDAMLSNLEKNQELKSLLIQETPWLRGAQSEKEQKKRIALLFELNKLENNLSKAIHKLSDLQLNNGGFPWFKGGNYPNIYITNHITTGFGHLNKLGIANNDSKIQKLLKKSVAFLDNEIVATYNELLKNAEIIKDKEGETASKNFLAKNNVNYFIIQYLYMRSFFNEMALNTKTSKAVSYYQKQTATYWTDFNLLAKGQIALTQHRLNNSDVALKIVKSLKETSIISDELGMYWKENKAGWYWHQAPIETQSLLIETFSEIENDTKTIDLLKVWLLKNKQVNKWSTTKATTNAIYSLLLKGSDWLSVSNNLDISVGNQKINADKLADVKVEAGTGYFKTSWNANEISKNLGSVTLTKNSEGIAWAGLYWQYFEDLDKITAAKTPLQLEKKLFKKVNSDTGKQLKVITNKTPLEVGDLVTVRIELKADRDMSFIHMKDKRAASFEPVDVLSTYKWQDGLGYYQSTKDAATNFFFDRLPKGIYIFEYDVRVNNKGNFSAGVTTIQSMYAPEFTSHSNGTRITVK